MFAIADKARISRGQLSRITITKRDKEEITDRWKGIRHGQLVDTLSERLNNAGFRIKDQRFSTCMDGAGLYGAFDLLPTKDLKVNIPKGVGLSLGFRHSNNGRYALQFFAGVKVFVCSNGMISDVFEPGDRKRHTKNLILSEVIDEGLETFGEAAKRGISKEITSLQGMDMKSELKVHHILCRAGATGVMPWSQIGKVEQAWRTPPHPEFKPRNGWSLYNAFTEVAKSFSAVNQAETLNGARLLLREVAHSQHRFN
jgi:hypothetical protein